VIPDSHPRSSEVPRLTTVLIAEPSPVAQVSAAASRHLRRIRRSDPEFSSRQLKVCPPTLGLSE
jgi:hypothetical protein